MSEDFVWLKGHGTENDFVLLPDHDADVHGVNLDPRFVTALCERRRGIGADGVLRVVRTTALDPAVTAGQQDVEWFMDYRNADGSLSQMCGNGIRVFALYLAREGLVDQRGTVAIGTRNGLKQVTYADDGTIAVDMGVPQLMGESKVGVGSRSWVARHVDVGNPHAVVFVDDLAEAGTLIAEPAYDRGLYPDGVNIEFVVRRGPEHVAMRVHERGSGETRSCGTGTCAAVVAATAADGRGHGVPYRVDVPGGTLHVTWRADGRMILAGPAEIVARGWMTWLGPPDAR